MIKDNIISTKYDFNGYMPGEIAKEIAGRVRSRRLELNLSQAALARRSGVSLGTLKHFERTSEISLKSLVLLAAAMDAADGFKNIFSTRNYATFDEAVSVKNRRTRKRGRIND